MAMLNKPFTSQNQFAMHQSNQPRAYHKFCSIQEANMLQNNIAH
jgi:hypothetical protein